MLAHLKLRFHSHLNLPKVQFETSRDSVFSQLTPSAIMRAKLDNKTLKVLEWATLDMVDVDRSYFALKWQFQMSLTSKIGSKRVFRHPNFFVYYSFNLEKVCFTRQLQLIGLQASSFGGLERWFKPGSDIQAQIDRDTYISLNNRLKALVQFSSEKETQKYLLSRCNLDDYTRDSAIAVRCSSISSGSRSEAKEKCYHSEFHAL